MQPSEHAPPTTTLTIVVPAYRRLYLRELLDSLVRQTDRDFDVFVGDDASPDDIAAVCAEYSSVLRLRYERFDENVGRRCLATQWNRCISYVSDGWVLMPGDDDVLHERCVEHFRAAVSATRGAYAAYRGTLVSMDADGRETSRHSPPAFSGAAEKIARVGIDHEMVIEYVFSVTRLRDVGGFVPFPLGWFSDNATWIRLAAVGGIHGVPEAMVYGRSSGINISSYDPGTQLTKLEANVQFIEWLATQRGRAALDETAWQESLERLSWRWVSAAASRPAKPSLRLSVNWSRRLGRLGGRTWFRYLCRVQKAVWRSRLGGSGVAESAAVSRRPGTPPPMP